MVNDSFSHRLPFELLDIVLVLIGEFHVDQAGELKANESFLTFCY